MDIQFKFESLYLGALTTKKCLFSCQILISDPKCC